jgi:hypothetical protein
MTDFPLRDEVLWHLPRDRSQAVTIARLAKMTGKVRREVEDALQELAGSGQYPICAATSKPYGIWLGSADEVHAYRDSLRRRMARMYLRERGLRKCERAMRDVDARVMQTSWLDAA